MVARSGFVEQLVKQGQGFRPSRDTDLQLSHRPHNLTNIRLANLQQAPARPLAKKLPHFNGPNLSLGGWYVCGLLLPRLHVRVSVLFSSYWPVLALPCFPNLGIRLFL